MACVSDRSGQFSGPGGQFKFLGRPFQRLLDDTRRELAQQYLGQRDVSLADTAYLLGFSDQSSCFRAARRWFGNSPGHFRLRLIRERPGRS
jgi:AraC-like DNA-binding protein